MFELLFKYPTTVFSKGDLLLLGRWPAWVLVALCIVSAAAIGALIFRVARGRTDSRLSGFRPAAIWLMESAIVVLVLLLLWQPAISIATLKPQQNIVAVLIDDSRSMALQEDGATRRDQAIKALEGGLLAGLREKFQVRLYRTGPRIERIEKLDQLQSSFPATRLGDSLKMAVQEASNLPIGAMVLVSDGADNQGGIDLETIAEIKRQRIPVHTIGIGREQMSRDLEIAEVQTQPRALADSRLTAQVTLRQRGYSGERARIVLRDGSKILASQDVVLKKDGVLQTEAVLFNAGLAGARNLNVSVEGLSGEQNLKNNSVTRLINVESAEPRILYIEGEPRWEYKFIRRAIGEDRSLRLVSMVRTTQNKIYFQGVDNSKEHEEGFPAKVEELFKYQGLIIGNVEVNYFTTLQQELIRQFVDRRGGGVLFLGGRAALDEGGWQNSPLAEILPAYLTARKGTFQREPATVELTPAGRDSLTCRLEDNPERNIERWRKMPYLADFQEVGQVKPGAVTLLEAQRSSGGKMPLLVTQNYGRGRTAIFATGGSWRWQMQQPLADRTHEMFWQQLLRWLVADTQGRLVASTPRPVLSDETRVVLRAEVRDRNYLPTADARVEARVQGPKGFAEVVEMQPDPLEPGVYTAQLNADAAGGYIAEIAAKRGAEEIGRDMLMFHREDGVAENFRVEQNRELLEKLSEQTGGRYWKPAEVSKLGRDISYSEAGITTREIKDLWNMPVIFLAVFGLKAGEWLLRRKWGAV
jgi:uncharacterized membrane protein